MSTDILYSLLGCITIVMTVLIAIYNLVHRGEADPEDKNLLAEIVASDDLSHLNWKDFQAEHVITSMEFPNHDKWCGKCWDDYILKGNISLSDEVHSIVSAVDDGEILQDFNPLREENKVHQNLKNEQRWYKSAHPRTIYHLQAGDCEGKCKVFKQTGRYLAALKFVDMCPVVISDQRLASANRSVWVPVCLEKITKSKLKSFKKINKIKVLCIATMSVVIFGIPSDNRISEEKIRELQKAIVDQDIKIGMTPEGRIFTNQINNLFNLSALLGNAPNNTVSFTLVPLVTLLFGGNRLG
ncbi:unnamed protein product [Allacma fusca]|uniref:Uncharacterized protein n=1 Tax=Allacma fusca TaxID=39272 RepID=A0A8J2NWY5_9HEXA|nr:unnamed protein product [Allacma fusca]